MSTNSLAIIGSHTVTMNLNEVETLSILIFLSRKMRSR